jgi:polyisoprenoid-binding protein YceI
MMMMNLSYRTLQILALSAFPLAAQPVVYVIDPAHSAVQFSVRHMMVSNTRGEFSKFEGSIVYDAKNPGATKVEATIDASSVNTREPRRDADLKGAEFFDIAKYPTLTFKSKSVTRSGDKLLVKGDLTIRNVTREVLLTVEEPTPEVKDQRGRAKIGASASTKVNRKDFGLMYNQLLETGGVVVGDEVTITLDIEATRKQ